MNATPPRVPLPQRLLAYITGAFALLLVAAAAVSALTYAVLHHSETLRNLATSTLTGVGMAVGGCLGSALILRFKAARRFIKGVVHDITNHEEAMNELSIAMQPVLVIREVQPDGSVDEARLYPDAWIGLFTDDYLIDGYHCTPAPISAP